MGGLTGRLIIVSSLLALVVGAAFAVLRSSIGEMRDTATVARHSLAELEAAGRVRSLLMDLEMDQRDFIITREERFIESWERSRAEFPGQARELVRLINSPAQKKRAQQIVQSGTSYIQDYAVPLVSAARRGDVSPYHLKHRLERRRHVDALRAEIDRFVAIERAFYMERQEVASAAARRAIIVTTGGLLASILFVILVAGYLTRAIIRPVRQVAGMADRLAGGDLGTRIPENGVAEVGVLERSFNAMATSLEESRDESRRLAQEQAALRRVATLVARGVPPPVVFAAVTKELGWVLGADATKMFRYGPHGRVNVVAAWSGPGVEIPAAVHEMFVEGCDVAALGLHGDGPARIDDFSDVPGFLAACLHQRGIHSAVSTPILVEGRRWGVMVAFSTRGGALLRDAGSRIADFTDLVATTIANTQARAELTASRARVVTATDQTRRRIERDLHDGVQQRMLSLTLNLRTAEEGVPVHMAELRAQLSAIADGLVGALDDLQEISRGIHPTILSEGGLGPALRALARRCAVVVELDVHIETRLLLAIEVAAYYVVAEALSNVIKHARASIAYVRAAIRDDRLELSVRDDGIGGADPARGSGLVGLTDRVEALGGTIRVISPTGGGTCLEVELPIESEPDRCVLPATWVTHRQL